MRRNEGLRISAGAGHLRVVVFGGSRGVLVSVGFFRRPRSWNSVAVLVAAHVPRCSSSERTLPFSGEADPRSCFFFRKISGDRFGGFQGLPIFVVLKHAREERARRGASFYVLSSGER